MYEREVDGRREVAITDIEALVPENHLVRKIEKVMDYEWIYERVAPYYSAAKNVRPGTDPVVLVKRHISGHVIPYRTDGFWAMGCWTSCRILRR